MSESALSEIQVRVRAVVVQVRVRAVVGPTGVQVSRWQAMLEANRKINYDMSKCMESNVSFEGEPVTSRVEVRTTPLTQCSVCDSDVLIVHKFTDSKLSQTTFFLCN